MRLTAKSPGHIYTDRDQQSIFWVLNLENLNCLGTGHSCYIFFLVVVGGGGGGLLNNKCCIFKCLKFSTVFLGLDLVPRYFIVNTVLHSYQIMLNICKMNCTLRQYFWGFAFHKAFSWVFSVAKNFLGRTELPYCTDPCL